MEIKKKQYLHLCEDVQEEVSLQANTTAFLMENMQDVSWVGFYLYRNNQLILGPFQGKVACLSIPMGKGVCGSAAQAKTAILVDNVHEFEGHIACDSASNSEIVLPILIKDELYGVLDIDSTSYARFTKQDQAFLEQILQIFITSLQRIKKQGH